MDFSGLYQDCRLCPRACRVDRLAGSNGFCGESAALRLAFAGLHRGEEPPLIGKGGSGTVFVSGCNLGCVFCQNWQISGGGDTGRRRAQRCLGRAVSTDEFTAICLELQNRGAENINIVTGSHAVPAIVQGLNAAATAGLHIPVLWNSSGYESPETLELLNGHIDTYMPDLKTLDSNLAAQFFNAPDYPQAASQAILWMMRHRPPCHVIIRHLILPGYLESTRAVLRWFADNARDGALLSLMSQYTPAAESNKSKDGPQRFLNKREYETVIGWLEEFGIEDGFCQELLTGSDWLPDFNRRNSFSSDLSTTIWHFMD
ncbi:MAG: radical SAM protein [Treponema sp.]|jgi:putative pyruvate formate lyase activating enzyme|nr:radical SAM protein [Treponema sp.]